MFFDTSYQMIQVMQQRFESNSRATAALHDNEEIILQAMSTFAPISSSMLRLEQQLYANAELLPRPIFKEFRRLRDEVEGLFSLLSSVSSDSATFNEQKDGYLQQQIQAMEAEINRQQPAKQRIDSRTRSPHPDRKSPLDSDQPDRRSDLLSKEIESLKNELRRNDAEYATQIKKYNIKYQQMQEEIDYYRRESERLEEYVEAIERLEVELRVMRESKERDEQLIQNMAWKLRNMQRDRYGRTAFLSPTSPKRVLNTSSRVQTHYSPRSQLQSFD